MSLRPTFMGFETMRKSLSASQKALDLTGNNISNVNTLGYSRQRLDLLSITTPGGGLRYNTAIALAGQGVGSSGVAQLRNEFYDRRYRELNADSAVSGTASKVLTDVQNVLDCIDTDGFNQCYTNFKDALSKFTVDSPNRLELANITLTAAKQMVSAVKSYDSKLNQIKTQTSFELQTGVDRVSEILKQVSDLNEQIANSYISSGDIFMDGNNYKVNSKYGPNELKDQRNNLIDELSNYGNVRITDNENGSINVEFANYLAVQDRKYSTFHVEEHSTGAMRVYFESQGGIRTEISPDENGISSGAVRGYLDMYNGAGIYSNDILTRKDGVETRLGEVNDILSEIKQIADAAPANMATRLGELQDKLNDYGLSFVINTTTGATTLNGTDLAVVGGDGKLQLTKLSVYPTADNKSLEIKAGTTTITFAATDDKLLNKNLNQTAENFFDGGSQGIVYYQKLVDALANTMARAFNEANSDTDTIDPLTGTYTTRPMFEPSGSGDEITAANIKVSSLWSSNPLMIAYQPSGTGSVAPNMTELDPRYLNKVKKVLTDKLDFTIDSAAVNTGDKVIDQNDMAIEQYIQYWSNNLGQAISYTNSVYDSADSMAQNIANDRDAVMSVSLDEEGTNMMTYQKWYNASARMMTTLDEALDTIIKSMGLVGR